MSKRTIAILGATGSIGTQALDIVRRYPDRFEATALVAHSSAEKLFELVREFRPKVAALSVEPEYIPEDVRFCQWIFGEHCSVKALEAAKPQDALCAIVGIAGLDAVWTALDVCERVLLANKEALVTGGELVMEKAARLGKPMLPVDSEHSAIFQCLNGQDVNRVKRILLTASGGPFRNFSKEQLANVTAAEALKHPKWTMGAKITIDSATMMNKGFEMIEARHLYNVAPKDIQIVIHPESIVHSAVEFADGAVIAQLGVPDMRLPIQYALGFPHRLPLPQAETLDLFQIGALHFEAPDPERFPCIRFAYDSIERGGNIPCVLNAAAEVTNEAFRKGLCTYPQMHTAIEQVLQQADFIANPQLDDLFQTDDWARRRTTEVLQTNATPQS